MNKQEQMMEFGGMRDHRDVDTLTKFCIECLVRTGYLEAYAKATAFALVEADARGIYSHGAAGGTGLEESITRSGVTATVNPRALPDVSPQKYATIGVINAYGAPGHVTSRMAVEWVKELARKHGMAKVYVNNANHFGAAGIWAIEIAKDKDLEAHVTCTTAATTRFLGHDNDGVDYTQGAAVGKQHRLGTNPDAYAIPFRDGMFVLDMANTELAASLSLKYFKEGRAAGQTKLLKVPNYVADKDFKSTLNPNEVYEIVNGKLVMNGSLFPYGGLRGYKGQGSLQRIEADHCFGGGPIIAVELGSKGADRRISHSFEAQAVDFLHSREQALDRMSELVRDWSMYTGPLTRMPGERSQMARDYSTQHGIPYSEGQIATLRRCGELAGGVDFDKMVESKGVAPFPVNLFTK